MVLIRLSRPCLFHGGPERSSASGRHSSACRKEPYQPRFRRPSLRRQRRPTQYTEAVGPDTHTPGAADPSCGAHDDGAYETHTLSVHAPRDCASGGINYYNGGLTEDGGSHQYAGWDSATAQSGAGHNPHPHSCHSADAAGGGGNSTAPAPLPAMPPAGSTVSPEPQILVCQHWQYQRTTTDEFWIRF